MRPRGIHLGSGGMTSFKPGVGCYLEILQNWTFHFGEAGLITRYGSYSVPGPQVRGLPRDGAATHTDSSFLTRETEANRPPSGRNASSTC